MNINSLDIHNQPVGADRVKEINSNITENDTFLPKPIGFEDIDRATFNFIRDEIGVEIDGDKVPTYVYSIQKWFEFTRTWDNSNEYKDVELPFISLVREPDVQKGENQDGLFDVPGFPVFTYKKIPTFRNGREGYDLYRIPQPTSTDLTYNVRFFSNRMSELNVIQDKIQRLFKAHQYYINVLGHPMPVLLVSVTDESNIDDIESRRYYVLNFELVINGYIINEEDFKVTPMYDRTMLLYEGDTNNDVNKPKLSKTINRSTKITTYDITFKRESNNNLPIIFKNDQLIETIKSEYNLSNYQFILNGEIVELPFTVNKDDKLNVVITRNDNNKISNLIFNAQPYFKPSVYMVKPIEDNIYYDLQDVFFEFVYSNITIPITQIEYYLNGELFTTKYNDFENLIWVDSDAGTHELELRIYQNDFYSSFSFTFKIDEILFTNNTNLFTNNKEVATNNGYIYYNVRTGNVDLYTSDEILTTYSGAFDPIYSDNDQFFTDNEDIYTDLE